jgi:hypothetical protein
MENSMDRATIQAQIKQLAALKTEGMYLDDFLLTWDRSDHGHAQRQYIRACI